MAKSARASSRKANDKKLRARVFAPVENARAERIHAKLLEIINQPKPEQTQMDTSEDATTADAAKEDDLPKDMDVDGVKPKPKPRDHKARRKDKKEERKKPKHQMAFPKSKGKGALKPYAGARVSKRK